MITIFMSICIILFISYITKSCLILYFQEHRPKPGHSGSTWHLLQVLPHHTALPAPYLFLQYFPPVEPSYYQ